MATVPKVVEITESDILGALLAEQLESYDSQPTCAKMVAPVQSRRSSWRESVHRNIFISGTGVAIYIPHTHHQAWLEPTEKEAKPLY